MQRNFLNRFLFASATAVLTWQIATMADDLYASMPNYAPHGRAAGTISAVGSDTMTNVVAYWVVGFKSFHPDVRARLLLGGSATAPPALLDGSATIAPMSRRMKDSEIQAFTKKFGYPPTEVRVAMDALSVYVNKDNPITGMTIAEVDAVFSATRNCGYTQDLTTWGQLGLRDGNWQSRPIALYSRNTMSGTYTFFSEHALCKGKFKNGIKTQASSEEVVRTIKAAPDAIGYSGMGFLKEGVRAVPLAVKAGEPFVPPTPENVYSGKYPLTRFLYVYINKAPGQPLPTLENEFVHLMLSAQGQSRVVQEGFIPLNSAMLREELAKIN